MMSWSPDAMPAPASPASGGVDLASLERLHAWAEANGAPPGMLSAASAVRAQPTFQQRPQDHLVVNGVESAMRNPLGELGALLSSRGALFCQDIVPPRSRQLLPPRAWS